MDTDVLITLANQWDKLPLELQQELEAQLTLDNQRDTLSRYGNCRHCQSPDVKTSEGMIICLSCGYCRDIPEVD